MNTTINSKAVRNEIQSMNCEQSEVTVKANKDITTILTVSLFAGAFVLISVLCALKVIPMPQGF